MNTIELFKMEVKFTKLSHHKQQNKIARNKNNHQKQDNWNKNNNNYNRKL